MGRATRAGECAAVGHPLLMVGAGLGILIDEESVLPEMPEDRELDHIRTFVVRAVYIDGSEADIVSLALKTREEAMALLDQVFIDWREPTEFDAKWGMARRYHSAVVALELFEAADGVIARYEIEAGAEV